MKQIAKARQEQRDMMNAIIRERHPERTADKATAGERLFKRISQRPIPLPNQPSEGE